MFLEVAQTYTDVTRTGSPSTPTLYATNAKVFISNQNGFISNNGMGVGVTAFNYGGTDNVSAESITIGDASDPSVPSKFIDVPLILGGSHGKNGTEVTMTITLIPLYPIGE